MALYTYYAYALRCGSVVSIDIQKVDTEPLRRVFRSSLKVISCILSLCYCFRCHVTSRCTMIGCLEPSEGTSHRSWCRRSARRKFIGCYSRHVTRSYRVHGNGYTSLAFGRLVQKAAHRGMQMAGGA